MSEAFIGEIRMFGGNFAPVGWALCNGQLLPISENDALFALIGTTYGGDGQTTFALPDLRSRIPVHNGQRPGASNYIIGQKAGTETTTLTVNNLPNHSHTLAAASATGTSNAPASNVYPAATASAVLYADTANAPVTMNSASVGVSGGSQPFSNVMPFQVVNFIISLYGIFPSRN